MKNMQPSPAGSFARFAIGFFVFISLSFGITYAVNSYTLGQEKTQQAAAANAALFGR
jgi:hypothetical protein